MILHAYYTVNYQNPLYLNLLRLLSSIPYACNHFELGVINCKQNKPIYKQWYATKVVHHGMKSFPLHAMSCHSTLYCKTVWYKQTKMCFSIWFPIDVILVIIQCRFPGRRLYNTNEWTKIIGVLSVHVES